VLIDKSWQGNYCYGFLVTSKAEAGRRISLSFDYYARIKVAIGLLLFFALLSNCRLFINSLKFDLSQMGRDDVTLYQKRFDEIRNLLPARGIVGYSGDGINQPEYWKSDASALRNWFLAQYTLAPVVVSITSNHKLSIINGSGGGSDPDSSENAGYTFRDLGNGMKLFDFGNGLKVVISEQ